MIVGCGSDRTLPNLVGLPLDEAKSTAESAGFEDVVSRDVLRSRSQFIDSNWQVCVQSPSSGSANAEAQVELGVVRTEEECSGESPTTSPTSTTTTSATPTAVPSADVDDDVDVDRPRTAVPRVPAPGSSGDRDGGGSSGAAYYRNCSAARAAGAAPMSAGSPGYRTELDRNRDGVACE